MVADIADLPTNLPAPEGIELRTATDDAGLWLVKHVQEEVFGGDFASGIASLRERLARDPNALAIVLAMADGNPVCASRVDFHEGTDFASLWAAARCPMAPARHIPRGGGLPRRAGRRAGLHLPTHRRPADQPADPGETRLRPDQHDHPLHDARVTPVHRRAHGMGQAAANTASISADDRGSTTPPGSIWLTTQPNATPRSGCAKPTEPPSS